MATRIHTLDTSLVPTQDAPELETRRSFLGKSGLVLSGAAVALLAGREALAKGNPSASSDVNVLNSALGAELEAIAAYQVGAESGLLQKPVLALAVTFQGHHKEHADVLAKTILKLGGQPVSAKAKYSFPVDTLKTQADVLRFAAMLEKGAVSAYLGAVPIFDNRDLAKAAASILGDEAMHLAILRNALGEVPVPSAFMS
jgi:rubrerythrin